MEIILNPGQPLEIERMLKITVFLPQICYFCGEEITKRYGQDSDSINFHSLDGNHDNWVPENKIPAHKGCHMRYHSTGKLRTEEWCKQHSDRMIGDKNPAKRPEVRKAISDARKGMIFNEEHRRNISKALSGEKNPNYGDKVSPEEWKIRMAKAWKKRRENDPNNESQKRTMDTRRAKYGPSCVKDPETSSKAISDGLKSRSEDEIRESVKRGLKTRRDRYGSSWVKYPEALGRAISRGMRKKGATKKAWDTRRRLYGPSGMKSKK